MSNENLAAEAVTSRVLALAANAACRGKTVSAKSSLRDLGLDYLDAVELVMAVEAEFDVDLEDAFGSESDPETLLPVTVQTLVDATIEAVKRKGCDLGADPVAAASIPVENIKPKLSSVEEVLASFPPHERRVIDEYCDLVGRRNRLIDFLGSVKFAELPIEDRDLLKRQLDVMDDYAKILVKRCDRFEVPAGLVLPGLVPVDKTADSVQNQHHDPDALAKEMVNRFLGWKLPGDFSPDGAIYFIPPSDVIPSGPHWPSGTNLFHAGQALEMFKHCLPPELLPLTPPDGPKLTPEAIPARVTPCMTTAAIVGVDYHVLPGTQITVCTIALRNGTKVLGWEQGRQAAYDMAREKVWELEGYALRERLAAPALTLNLSESQRAELLEQIRNASPGTLMMQAAVGGPGLSYFPEHGAAFAVLDLVRSFVAKHRISCPEIIHQTDRVIEDAYGFIESLVDVAGYYRDQDDADGGEVQP